MLPWSDEKRKDYIMGAVYNYVRLIADRKDPRINVVDHPHGIYKLASPFRYSGNRPILEGFKLVDGAILDSTFCELVTDEEAEPKMIVHYIEDTSHPESLYCKTQPKFEINENFDGHSGELIGSQQASVTGCIALVTCPLCLKNMGEFNLLKKEQNHMDETKIKHSIQHCVNATERLHTVVSKLEKMLETFKPENKYLLYGKSGLAGRYTDEEVIANDLLELNNKICDICDRLNNLTLYTIKE